MDRLNKCFGRSGGRHAGRSGRGRGDEDAAGETPAAGVRITRQSRLPFPVRGGHGQGGRGGSTSSGGSNTVTGPSSSTTPLTQSAGMHPSTPSVNVHPPRVAARPPLPPAHRVPTEEEENDPDALDDEEAPLPPPVPPMTGRPGRRVRESNMSKFSTQDDIRDRPMLYVDRNFDLVPYQRIKHLQNATHVAREISCIIKGRYSSPWTHWWQMCADSNQPIDRDPEAEVQNAGLGRDENVPDEDVYKPPPPPKGDGNGVWLTFRVSYNCSS